PRLIERIRVAIPSQDRAYLTTYNSTPLERKLAVLLGIPLNGVDPDLAPLGSKSGSRRIFHEAGLAGARGTEDVRTEEDVLAALRELRRADPSLRRAVVKLDEGFSGAGNAIVTLPASGPVDGRCLESLGAHLKRLRETGGVVEELLEGEDVTSPSVQ